MARRVKRIGVEAVYHCMSRTVAGAYLFGEGEKEMLRRMLWQVAAFSGVEVLTYAVLSNHFHVLVRVPVAGALSDAELVRRYRVLYPGPGPGAHGTLTADSVASLLAGGGREAAALRAQLQRRMGDVSEYMKTLKQRFSVWYNRSHDRYGTLWSERFKSVLVQGRGNPLQTMAAYIDLNPVRAGLAEDPKDYRFCGYAEAVAGLRRARDGLWRVWADRAGAADGAAAALQMHRQLVFAKGQSWAQAAGRQALLEALERGEAPLPKAAVLRCRVRYLSDGAVLGTAQFVRECCARAGAGRKRPPKPTPLTGAAWGDLAVMKNIRSRIFG